MRERAQILSDCQNPVTPHDGWRDDECRKSVAIGQWRVCARLSAGPASRHDRWPGQGLVGGLQSGVNRPPMHAIHRGMAVVPGGTCAVSRNATVSRVGKTWFHMTPDFLFTTMPCHFFRQFQPIFCNFAEPRGVWSNGLLVMRVF